MDVPELTDALVHHFLEKEYDKHAADLIGLDMAFKRGGEIIGFALCPDKTEDMAYLGAFEAAVMHVIDARHKLGKEIKLALAIAFGSTAEGASPSYRRALKKYSNSIVFEDLGLSLYLVTGREALIVLLPTEINPFLRNLNEWIAQRKSLS